MVERDKNHPSVIAWSLGNETSGGANLQKMYDWAKNRDITRPVQYQGSGPFAPYTDMAVPFYPNVEGLKEMSDEIKGPPDNNERITRHFMGNKVAVI